MNLEGKIEYLSNCLESEKWTNILGDIFIPYKASLRVSKLKYMSFADVWNSMSHLMSFDTGTYNENVSNSILLNIVKGLDSLQEGLAGLISRDIIIKKKDVSGYDTVKKVMLTVCRFNTIEGHKPVNNIHNLPAESKENLIFFNGNYYRLGRSEEVNASMVLGLSWSNLIAQDEKGFYAPQEYISFIIQQIALLITSYLEKEPSQYLVMQTEAMKRSIYSNWESIYKNYMPELQKQESIMPPMQQMQQMG